MRSPGARERTSLERTAELYADERGRFTRAVEALGLPDDQGERLVAALDGVRRAR